MKKVSLKNLRPTKRYRVANPRIDRVNLDFREEECNSKILNSLCIFLKNISLHVFVSTKSSRAKNLRFYKSNSQIVI
jgi:hypothetical protein